MMLYVLKSAQCSPLRKNQSVGLAIHRNRHKPGMKPLDLMFMSLSKAHVFRLGGCKYEAPSNVTIWCSQGCDRLYMVQLPLPRPSALLPLHPLGEVCVETRVDTVRGSNYQRFVIYGTPRVRTLAHRSRISNAMMRDARIMIVGFERTKSKGTAITSPVI